jgi:hypothetical protein
VVKPLKFRLLWLCPKKSSRCHASGQTINNVFKKGIENPYLRILFRQLWSQNSQCPLNRLTIGEREISCHVGARYGTRRNPANLGRSGPNFATSSGQAIPEYLVSVEHWNSTCVDDVEEELNSGVFDGVAPMARDAKLHLMAEVADQAKEIAPASDPTSTIRRGLPLAFPSSHRISSDFSSTPPFAACPFAAEVGTT